MLLLASDPHESASKLWIDDEARMLTTAIRNARDRDSIEVHSERAAKIGDLQRVLLTLRPTIVHFVGHRDRFSGIYLTDDAGNPHAVGPDILQRTFSVVSEVVRLVVLNVGETMPTAEALSTVIDYVIGMDAEISEPAAVMFAKTLYQSLASGMSVKQAFELGVGYLRMGIEREHRTPKLLIRKGVNPDSLLTSATVSLAVDPSAWRWLADPRAPSPEQTKGIRTAVFISYSHNDYKWLERLQIHLRPLERDHDLEVWDDTKIRPGEDWRTEIRNAIGTAKVAILLVSADFLASDFIAKNELPPLLKAAEEDGALILPVIVSPCRFVKTQNLSGFQAVNDPDRPLSEMKVTNRERVFTKVADEVARAFEI